MTRPTRKSNENESGDPYAWVVGEPVLDGTVAWC